MEIECPKPCDEIVRERGEAIGKYEHNEAVPSVETAKNIADLFVVSLDYLVGNVLKPAFDKKMVEHLEDFELLAEEDKNTFWHCSMHFCAMPRQKRLMHKKPPERWLRNYIYFLLHLRFGGS